MTPSEQRHADVSAQEAVDSNPRWYHTIELAPGVVTPGWFDLRPIVERMPWPDVAGRRCLDVGTYDGFLAFEMERRGAAEVIALDIGDHTQWDWPYRLRRRGPDHLAEMAGPETGIGFEIARRLLGSAVERVQSNVYELSPEAVGEFDLVTCGSLMLHLRDPVLALERIRAVCRGVFLSAETISLGLTALHRGRPVARLLGGDRSQWTIPNTAGHRTMVAAAGFEVEETTRPYAIPLGPGHPAARRGLSRLRERITSRLLAGGAGVPHAALLARPLSES
jgi:tRNA (mo5U34)-methyltransferase